MASNGALHAATREVVERCVVLLESGGCGNFRYARHQVVAEDDAPLVVVVTQGFVGHHFNVAEIAIARERPVVDVEILRSKECAGRNLKCCGIGRHCSATSIGLFGHETIGFVADHLIIFTHLLSNPKDTIVGASYGTEGFAI